MQPAGKLIINVSGDDKSFFLWNGTESYYEKLRAAYTDIKKDTKSEYLYFSFFTLCCTTLEYSLNFIIADFCVNKFGPERYKEYCEGYINLPFRKKLYMIPSIVSDGKLEINETNSSFKKLEELITMRNRILHNKEFLKEFDFPKLEGSVENGKFILSEERPPIDFKVEIEDNYIETLTKEKCMDYGNALGDFKKYIMTPSLFGKLEENIMISKQKWSV